MKILGRIVCLWSGHKKGVAVFGKDYEAITSVKILACPRCGTTWIHGNRPKNWRGK